MKRKASASILVAALLCAAPAHAGFLAEKIDEGIYFVSYQRGQLLRGEVLFDTEKRVIKRIEKKSHKFCLDEGYGYLKFPTLAEIAKDETLRTVWQIAAGDESQNTSEVEGDLYGLKYTHKSRRILLLSRIPEEDFAACQTR